MVWCRRLAFRPGVRFDAVDCGACRMAGAFACGDKLEKARFCGRICDRLVSGADVGAERGLGWVD